MENTYTEKFLAGKKYKPKGEQTSNIVFKKDFSYSKTTINVQDHRLIFFLCRARVEFFKIISNLKEKLQE